MIRTMDDSAERALKVHLEEYKAVRHQLSLMIELQNRLLNYSVGIIAGTVTLSWLGQQALAAQQPFVLLIASVLMSALSWALIEAELQLHDAARYLRESLYPKIQALVGSDLSSEYLVLRWAQDRRRSPGRVLARGMTALGKFLVAYVPSILFVIVYLLQHSSTASAWTPPETALLLIASSMALLTPVGLLLNLVYIRTDNVDRGGGRASWRRSGWANEAEPELTAIENRNEGHGRSRAWDDLRALLEARISSETAQMETKARRRRFHVLGVSEEGVRVRREHSSLPHEDIPKGDFIDIWDGINKPEYASAGYMQRDLHNGQNRNAGVSFALMALLPYVEYRKVGRGWGLFLTDG